MERGSVLCLLGAFLAACSPNPDLPGGDAGPAPGDTGVSVDAEPSFIEPLVLDDAPLLLGLAVNHLEPARIVRGWPIVVRATASVRRILPGSLTLSRFELTAADAMDQPLGLPLEPVTPDVSTAQLGPERPSVGRLYVASGTVTRALSAGEVRLRLLVGEQQQVVAVAVAVVDPPAAPNADDRLLEALHGFDYYTARGEHESARAVVADERSAAPDDPLLLELEGRALFALGRLEEALARGETAVAILRPLATEEPPDGLLTLRRAIRQAIGGGP